MNNEKPTNRDMLLMDVAKLLLSLTSATVGNPDSPDGGYDYTELKKNYKRLKGLIETIEADLVVL